MVELKAEIERIARSDAKVLITGESGTGKELVAQAVHNGSRRSERPFVAVNCAGLTETLLETELFGHVKGSFTGAYRDKLGKLELADSGTMFLDEIGEMTLRMQGLLLRFLETGELQKVGADRIVGRVDVRVLAATNRNLRDMIGQGTFREDLFYRLNVIHLTVPPLRERKPDIGGLALHFMTQFTTHMSSMAREISQEATACLTEYHWPGNVRELENVIERLMVTGGDGPIRPEDLPIEIRVRQGVGFGLGRNVGGLWRMISIGDCSRNANRSGRLCIRFTCSVRLRARTFGIWSERVCRRRGGTTRSWRGSSTWTIATTRNS